jgi:hypothetical protein
VLSACLLLAGCWGLGGRGRIRRRVAHPEEPEYSTLYSARLLSTVDYIHMCTSPSIGSHFSFNINKIVYLSMGMAPGAIHTTAKI